MRTLTFVVSLERLVELEQLELGHRKDLLLLVQLELVHQIDRLLQALSVLTYLLLVTIQFITSMFDQMVSLILYSIGHRKEKWMVL